MWSTTPFGNMVIPTYDSVINHEKRLISQFFDTTTNAINLKTKGYTPRLASALYHQSTKNIVVYCIFESEMWTTTSCKGCYNAIAVATQASWRRRSRKERETTPVSRAEHNLFQFSRISTYVVVYLPTRVLQYVAHRHRGEWRLMTYTTHL